MQADNDRYRAAIRQLKIEKGLTDQNDPGYAGGGNISASDNFSKKFESGSEAAMREDSGELKFNEELDYDRAPTHARGVQEAELARLEQARQNIEERLKEQERVHKKELRQWDKQVRDKEGALVMLQRELKEREQENRISKLKIKEMKRLIKHNQLKPLDPKDLTPMEETEKDGERTVNSAGLKAVEEGKEDMSNLGYHHEILDDPLKLKMKVRATDPPSRLEAEYSD